MAEEDRKTSDGPDRQAATPDIQTMPFLGTLLLGCLLVVLGLALTYALVATWPAVEAATAEQPAPHEIELFGIEYEATPQTALILLVVFAGALGSYIHVANSFADYVGNRRLARSWTWWYLLRIYVGAGLALLFYFAVRGGFFGADASENVINPYGMAALAGLVGLFSKQATDKLREVFDTLFRVQRGGDKARSDSIENPVPVIAGFDPPAIPVSEDAVRVRLRGQGFVPTSVVRVSRADREGLVLERDTTYVSPTELDVTLNAEDVAAAGALSVMVFNPPPGGGVAGPKTLEVTLPSEVAGSTDGE